jgi:type II secretory pathway pseudopilin PulG
VKRLREITSREDGFTIIEILIAAFILVLGALAVFMTFASAVHNIQRGREQQVGVSVAQREMEKVRVLPFDSVGLSSTPTFSADPKNPGNRVSGSGSSTQFDLIRGGATENRKIRTGGSVVPVSTGVRSPDGTEATVYRFVTCEEEACLAKRVVIDVLPVTKGNLAGYRHSYYELQTTLVDPEPGS